MSGDEQRGIDALPLGMFAGASRYDTDDTHVLHLWTADGQSFDVRWPQRSSGLTTKTLSEALGLTPEQEAERVAGLNAALSRISDMERGR